MEPIVVGASWDDGEEKAGRGRGNGGRCSRGNKWARVTS